MAIFNFRADRVVELSKAFEYKDFNQFDRKRHPDVRTLFLIRPFPILSFPQGASMSRILSRALIGRCQATHDLLQTAYASMGLAPMPDSCLFEGSV